jgi:hypothetical protein
MGLLSAMGMAEVADLDTALGWHLSSNHFPPVPSTMIDPCKQAISAFGDEDYDRLIDLPEGISWRGEVSAPASAIVEGHHLDAFL